MGSKRGRVQARRCSGLYNIPPTRRDVQTHVPLGNTRTRRCERAKTLNRWSVLALLAGPKAWPSIKSFVCRPIGAFALSFCNESDIYALPMHVNEPSLNDSPQRFCSLPYTYLLLFFLFLFFLFFFSGVTVSERRERDFSRERLSFVQFLYGRCVSATDKKINKNIYIGRQIARDGNNIEGGFFFYTYTNDGLRAK